MVAGDDRMSAGWITAMTPIFAIAENLPKPSVSIVRTVETIATNPSAKAAKGPMAKAEKNRRFAKTAGVVPARNASQPASQRAFLSSKVGS